MIASTNDAFCPTLRAITKSALPEGVNSVLEIVINGTDATVDRRRHAGRESMRPAARRRVHHAPATTAASSARITSSCARSWAGRVRMSGGLTARLRAAAPSGAPISARCWREPGAALPLGGAGASGRCTWRGSGRCPSATFRGDGRSRRPHPLRGRPLERRPRRRRPGRGRRRGRRQRRRRGRTGHGGRVARRRGNAGPRAGARPRRAQAAA